MEKFNFDKLMDVINYYDVQRDFIIMNNDDEYESFNFERFEQMGIDEDDYPYNFKEFLKHNIKLDKIAIWAGDHSSEPIIYWFNADDNSISIDGEEYTIKEALTIINLVMEHQRLNKRWCHNVTFATDNDKERVVYAQESTTFGLWWNGFIQFYEQHMADISSIDIDLGMTTDRSIDITLFMKTTNEDEDVNKS